MNSATTNVFLAEIYKMLDVTYTSLAQQTIFAIVITKIVIYSIYYTANY